MHLVVVGMLFCLVASCALVQGKPKVIKADRTRQFTLHIDERFSKADRDVVVDAFSEWERDTHGIVRFVVSPTKWSTGDDMEYSIEDDNGCTVDVYVASIDSGHKSVRDFERGSGSRGNTLGYTQHQCDAKFVAFIMDRIHGLEQEHPQLLREVGIHEAGHLVGLAHIPVPNESIMFPSMDAATKCPTKLDMKQFCMLYGCDWHDMKTCSDVN
jgi:hypothetical protein